MAAPLPVLRHSAPRSETLALAIALSRPHARCTSSLTIRVFEKPGPGEGVGPPEGPMRTSGLEFGLRQMVG
eukprot:8812242-Pyramimonas_sp.AAC.1